MSKSYDDCLSVRIRCGNSTEAEDAMADAAPALLAALRKLLGAAEAVHSFGLPDYVPPLTAVCFSDAQMYARDAIAAAEQSETSARRTPR